MVTQRRTAGTPAPRRSTVYTSPPAAYHQGMRNRLAAVTARAVLSSFFLLTVATPALAIDRAPSAKESGNWLAVLAIFLFIVAVCVGCFMSPRRTHLD